MLFFYPFRSIKAIFNRLNLRLSQKSYSVRYIIKYILCSSYITEVIFVPFWSFFLRLTRKTWLSVCIRIWKDPNMTWKQAEEKNDRRHFNLLVWTEKFEHFEEKKLFGRWRQPPAVFDICPIGKPKHWKKKKKNGHGMKKSWGLLYLDTLENKVKSLEKGQKRPGNHEILPGFYSGWLRFLSFFGWWEWDSTFGWFYLCFLLRERSSEVWKSLFFYHSSQIFLFQWFGLYFWT